MVLTWSIVLVAALSGCALGPATPHVRVRNHAAHNLRVKALGGKSAGSEELVYPGNFSRTQGPGILVKSPDAMIRLTASAENVSSGHGYRFRHVPLRDIGQNIVVFEVMVDNENRTWIHALDGERVAFPSERAR
ncbi:hypothetical protein AYO49_04390 [Verrucomicrobiaceae bacterium SCGC AG-212-N21]|nr:hypothetical protein AYO49_04390 [Verrucomicrobiaceae bacterium SCGC AG-212-N21]